MNTSTSPERSPGPPSRADRTVLTLLAALLGLEALGLAVVSALLVAGLVVGAARSAVDGLAFVVLVVVATVFVAALAVAAARSRTWMRAGSVVWHVLEAIVAVGAFEGLYGSAGAGAGILAAAVVGFALTVSPPVTRATAPDRDRRARRDDPAADGDEPAGGDR